MCHAHLQPKSYFGAAAGGPWLAFAPGPHISPASLLEMLRLGTRNGLVVWAELFQVGHHAPRWVNVATGAPRGPLGRFDSEIISVAARQLAD